MRSPSTMKSSNIIDNATQLTQIAVTVAGAFALYKVYSVMRKSSDAIGETAGGWLAKVQQFVNGNHDIEASSAGIPLTDLGLQKHGESLYFMTTNRRAALAAMHPDNEKIIAAVFTYDGYVKGPYLSFINNQPVTLADI